LGRDLDPYQCIRTIDNVIIAYFLTPPVEKKVLYPKNEADDLKSMGPLLVKYLSVHTKNLDHTAAENGNGKGRDNDKAKNLTITLPLRALLDTSEIEFIEKHFHHESLIFQDS